MIKVANPLRGYSAVIGEQQFRRFFGARAISSIGDAAVPTALALSTIAYGYGAAELAILMAAAMLPRALFMLHGGLAADRLPKRRLLLMAWLFSGTAQMVSAVLFLTHGTFGWIVFAQACYGVIASVSYPANFGYLPSLIEPASLGAANALISSWIGLASLAGPALTALCAAAGSPAYALLIDGASFLVGAYLLTKLPEADGSVGMSGRGPATLRKGWAALRAIPWLLKVNLVVGLLLMVTVAPVMVLGPELAAQVSSGTWVAMMAAFAVGELTGGIASGRLQTRHPVLVAVVGLSLLGLPPAVLASGGGTILLCAAEVCAGIGYTAHVVLIGTAMQKAAPPEHRSKIGAFSTAGTYIWLPLGYVFAPIAAARFGTNSVLWQAAAWSLIAVGLLVASSAVRKAIAEPATTQLQPQVGTS